MEKVKIVVDNTAKATGCPEGQLRKDKGTPGPNC